MPVKAFDHVAIPTADAERFLAYYKRLGFTFINEEKWRRGESPIFSLRIGEHNMINVHPEGFTANLRGQTAVPGCGDLCFVWDGTIEEVQEMLAKAGVEPVTEPVLRYGGRNGGKSSSTSIYIVDPDKNLVEFMVYDE